MHFSSKTNHTSATRTWAIAASLFVALLIGQSAWSADKKEDADSKTLSASFVTSMASINDEHKLGPGDQISIRIIEDEDPAIRRAVTDSGDVDVPYLGLLKVSDKTCRAIANEIRAGLEKKYYYKATVIIGLDVMAPKGTVSKGKIYLMGQVRAQGPMELPADEEITLSKAILRAGGFGEYANKRKVKLIRPTKSGVSDIKIIDLVEILEKGKTDKDIVVQPEDRIVVPERGFNF